MTAPQFAARDQRQQLDLRDLVENTRRGMLPEIQDEITEALKQAYWLGLVDGKKIATSE